MARGETGYFDPETGLFVFTALQHLARGYCCGSGCRHCPYDHANVPDPTAVKAAADNPPVTLKKSPLFTRTGDRGITSISSGERRSKDHPVIVVMGDLDELNSHIGLAHSTLIQQQSTYRTDDPEVAVRCVRLARQLQFVQHKLFDVGGAAGSAGETDPKRKVFNPQDVTLVEEWIQDLTAYLPNIASFIIPTGGLVSGELHVARTACRRAERSLVLLNGLELVDPAALQYVNRLSDFLFAAARLSQHLEGQPDIPVRRHAVWTPDPAPAPASAPPAAAAAAEQTSATPAAAPAPTSGAVSASLADAPE